MTIEEIKKELEYIFGANYTKRTALWGQFNSPQKDFFAQQLPPHRTVSDVITHMTHRNKYDRMNARSMCYPTFAKRFFEANP